MNTDLYTQRAYQLLKGAQTVTTIPTANLSTITRNRLLKRIDPTWAKGRGTKTHTYGQAAMLATILRNEYRIPNTETWGDESEFNVRYEHLPPEAYARLNELFIAEKACIRMHSTGKHRDYRNYGIERHWGIWGGANLPETGRIEFRHIREDAELREMMLAVMQRPEIAERIALAVQHVIDGRPLHTTYVKE